MELAVINGLGYVLLAASIVTIFILGFKISTDLTLKKVLYGVMTFIVFGISMVLLSLDNIDRGFSINENFFLLIFCMGSLGVIFVVGRWISNRSYARFKRQVEKLSGETKRKNRLE